MNMALNTKYSCSIMMTTLHLRTSQTTAGASATGARAAGLAGRAGRLQGCQRRPGAGRASGAHAAGSLGRPGRVDLMPRAHCPPGMDCLKLVCIFLAGLRERVCLGALLSGALPIAVIKYPPATVWWVLCLGPCSHSPCLATAQPWPRARARPPRLNEERTITFAPLSALALSRHCTIIECCSRGAGSGRPRRRGLRLPWHI